MSELMRIGSVRSAANTGPEVNMKKRSAVHFSTVGHVNEQVVMIALMSQSYGLRLDTFSQKKLMQLEKCVRGL